MSSQLARTPHLHPAGKVQMGTAAAPKPGWDLSLAGNPPSRASLLALGDSGAGNAIPGLPGGRQQPRKVPARDGSGYGVQGFVSRLKKKKKSLQRARHGGDLCLFCSVNNPWHVLPCGVRVDQTKLHLNYNRARYLFFNIFLWSPSPFIVS